MWLSPWTTSSNTPIRRKSSTLVLDTLRFKCDVLWTQLDALYIAYVEPGLIPPGAFVPSDHPR